MKNQPLLQLKDAFPLHNKTLGKIPMKFFNFSSIPRTLFIKIFLQNGTKAISTLYQRYINAISTLCQGYIKISKT